MTHLLELRQNPFPVPSRKHLQRRGLALAVLGGLVALLAAGCGATATGEAPVAPSQFAQAAFAEATPAEEFRQELGRRGVSLSDAEFASVVRQRQIQPAGCWAPRPAAGLDARANLEVHFKKHQSQVGPPRPRTAEEYMALAIASAKGERGTIAYYFDLQSFDKGYQSHVVRWNQKSRELTALRDDGCMTTYYRDDNLKPSRFVVVPQL